MKKDKIVFKVRYGFDKMSHVRIEAGPELEKVIYAWRKQIPVTLGDRIIQGKHIISIEPDYHYYTGWYESYQPVTGDDWAQIDRDCPKFDGYIEAYRNRVNDLIERGKTNLIGMQKPLEIGGAIDVTERGGAKSMREVMEARQT